MKTLGYIFIGLIAILLVVGSPFLGLWYYGYFAPRYENVRREVFEETKSYTHGKIQDLSKYYREYNNATKQDDKDVIKILILSQFAEFDESNIKVFLPQTGY